jgi:hypothetical protein
MYGEWRTLLLLVTSHSRKDSVSVSAPILDDYVIRPSVIQDYLGGAHYANFLERNTSTFIEGRASICVQEYEVPA